MFKLLCGLLLESFLVVVLVSFASYPALPTQTERHEGDLVLEGNDQLLVQNKTLIVRGNIILQGNAQLVLKSASHRIDQTYHEQFKVALHDQAKLIIDNSTFDATFDFVEIVLWGRASLLVTNSRVNHIVILLDSASVEVTGSFVKHLSAEENGYKFNNRYGRAKARTKDSEIYEVTLGISRYCVLSVSNLKPGKGLNVELSPTSLEAGDIPFEVQLLNCTINYCNFLVGDKANVKFKNCDIFQLSCYGSARITAENSTVAQIVLTLENLKVSFGGLKTGYYKDWELRARSGTLPCSFRLVNTVVSQGWYLRLRRGNYEIYDSDIVRFRNEFDSPDSKYLLEDCCILEWMPWWSNGEITLRDCVIGTVQAPDAAAATIRGEFCVLEPTINSFWGPWRNNAKIRRYFPIQVFELTGKPASGVTVEVIAPTGQLLHRAQTDSSGRIEVSILFEEKNYSAMYRVQVPKFGYTYTFGLLSSTPICLPQGSCKFTCPDCTNRIPGMRQ